MAEQPLRPPPVMPDAGTPDAEFDETLGRAIDAGRIDPALADADPKLAGVFAAHQKLESLFALIRGPAQPDEFCRERPLWRSADPQPTHLGRYQVKSTLGAGAFGTVYLAHDPELSREVAIKVSRAGTFTSAGALDKFRAEARHAASLNHPQIVTIHDVGREGDRLYIVMHYVPGRTLAELMADGPVAATRAAELLATVADALHYAQKLGFVHRDLKPANILLDEHGQPHIADFGLAVSEATQQKLAGQVAGTPEYMAPEQVRGESHRLDGRTDIWALGVVLYEAISGRRPFSGRTTRDLLDEIEHRDPKPPRQINDGIPAELERICLKCLAKRMTDRYSTAADLAADLRHFREQANLLPLPPHPQPGTLGRGEGMSPRSPASLAAPPVVVPKGLRSFDAHDADFFLQLLPGPFDRDGLPESLRFWKTRIEQTDSDATFAVGLIYGPSGCGKSSLVKAGLLPRLSPQVLPVYVEATADDTEVRLLKGLRNRSSGLATEDLASAIGELRTGGGLAAGQKVLIVLDQFEQWLHTHGDPQATDLVRALRQCDGAHVQCVVMVRDDFWLAASRFMQALEISLDRENSALVDLFDTLHAHKVLALFGRAYGRLRDESVGNGPQAVPPIAFTREQEQFIEEAVAGLAENSKVISVRLALFAEMVKGKPWTPATLKEMGGIAGVGLTFLEETFSATTAPPQHRLHQRAAQAVLKALLPPAGTNFKGHQRSEGELLKASAYAGRPRDFDELLRILDAELHLITPTDPVGQAFQLEEGSGLGVQGSEVEAYDSGHAADNPKSKIENPKSYQLTHDYLVPSLREWLTRKQRETRRGRAELRLAERATAYQAQADPRNLPGWWEWPNILLFTRGCNSNPAERRVMRAATRRRGLQATLVVLLVMAGTLAGREARRRVNEDRDRVRADGLVQRLLEAPLAAVPADVAELEPYRQWTDPKLRQILASDSTSTDAQRLRASMGLLTVDPTYVEPIFDAMLDAAPDDARVLIGMLKPRGLELVEQLWQVLADGKASPSSRLRAAMALANYTPANDERERWLAHAPVVVDQILAETRQDPSQYEPLVAALAPAAEVLLPALGTVFRDSERNVAERELATSMVAKYASHNAPALVDFINDAEPQQFLMLFPALEKHGGAAIDLLTAELEKEATFNWHDPPRDPSWQTPASSTVARIEAAGGMLAERFALVQTLPFDGFATLAEELRPCGYRPLRCRPYAAGDRIQVASVWTRDAHDWKSAVDLKANDVLAQNAEMQNDGFVPVDLAGYPTKRGTRFTVLWSHGTGDERRLFLDLATASAGALPEAKDLQEMNFRAVTLHAYTSPEGGTRYAYLFRKEPKELDWRPIAETSPANYQAESATDLLQNDVSLLIATPAPAKRVDATVALKEADKLLAAKPDDIGLRLLRGIARYYAADDLGAIEDMTVVAEKQHEMAGSFGVRALAHARLQHADEARADLKRFNELGGAPSLAAHYDAVVSARLGNVDDGLARLDEAVTRHTSEASFLFEAACACSLVADLLPDDMEKTTALKHHAVDLLKQAIENGWNNFEHIPANNAFDTLRDLPAFQAMLTAAHPEQRYAAVFEANAAYVSVSPHGLGPDEHLERCRELARQGYRPVAISLAQTLEANAQHGGESTGFAAPTALVAASVWWSPRIEDAEKERLAQRQANAAVALMRLGQAERVWPLLRHSRDPRLRTWLIHRMAACGVEPKLLMERLFIQQDVARPPSTVASESQRGATARSVSEERWPSATDVLFDTATSIPRALILALGVFDEARLPHTDRAALLDKLTQLYRVDPDAGVHGAAAWLVRRFGGGDKLAQVDHDLRGDKPASHGRRWFVNSQGQTMVVIAGPAEFFLGSPSDEPGRARAEALDKRRIERSFAIGAHEVTVDQIRCWRGAFRYASVQSPTGDCPMNGVSWYTAAEYCNWLSEEEGLRPCYEPNSQGEYADEMRPAADYLARDGYRLPTEAEWEFACRAGTTTSRYYGASESLLDQYACYAANSQQRMFPVGSLKPNDFGLFDMLGNADEWCGDSWRETYAYRRLDRHRNDVGDVSALSDRVPRYLAGGTFYDQASGVRCACRRPNVPSGRNYVFDFRLARTLSLGSPTRSPTSKKP